MSFRNPAVQPTRGLKTSMRIYVSSTFEDLKDYRAAVNQAVRGAGYELVAMEDYPAFDQRPADKCLADVATCHFYVGILARRYGHVPDEHNPERLSITGLEYRQAGRSGIQRLMFQLDPKAPWLPDYDDRITKQGREGTQIEFFRREVGERHGNKFFRNTQELVELVLEALNAELLKRYVALATAGLDAFHQLLNHPEILRAVIRSEEVLEDIHRQLARLERLKSIHDALHQIEQLCLKLMEHGKSRGWFKIVKNDFGAEAREIQDRLKGADIDPVLVEKIEGALQSVMKILEQPKNDASADAAFENIAQELTHLVSSIPGRIDDKITTAARDLKLKNLIKLMMMVRNAANEASRSGASDYGGDIEKLDLAIRSYEELDKQLNQRVNEHSRLQHLDQELRAALLAPETLIIQWVWIKRERARLVPPFSQELQQFIPELEETEAKIEEVGRNNNPEAFNLLTYYFERLSRAFLKVNNGLKEFCGELSKMNRPLKDITDMLKTR